MFWGSRFRICTAKRVQNVLHNIWRYLLNNEFLNAISKMFQCNCEMNVLDCMSPSNLNSANFICYLILIWFVRTSIYYQFKMNMLFMGSSNQFQKIRISTLHEFNHLRFKFESLKFHKVMKSLVEDDFYWKLNPMKSSWICFPLKKLCFQIVYYLVTVICYLWFLSCFVITG